MGQSVSYTVTQSNSQTVSPSVSNTMELFRVCSFFFLVVVAGSQLVDPEDNEDSALSKTLCCVDARNQCGIWCGTKPWEETCTFYCGPFNTNCGTWTCSDMAGFSCTKTTTTTRATTTTTASVCAATGATCYDNTDPTATVIKECCTATDRCRPTGTGTPYTCQA